MFSDVFKKAGDSDSSAEAAISKPKDKESPSRMSKSSTAILSEDVEFKGVLNFNSSMEIHGRFEGQIFAEGDLVIGESALVKADIQSSSSVVIRGKVQGNVTAKEKVEISSKAQLYGDVTAPRFILAEGAAFVGSSRTSDKTSPPSDFSNIFTRLDKPKSGSSPSGSGYVAPGSV